MERIKIWHKPGTCMETGVGNNNPNEEKFINALTRELTKILGVKYLCESKDHLILEMLKTSLNPIIKDLLEQYCKLKFEELFKFWKNNYLEFYKVKLPEKAYELYDIHRFELMGENFIKALLKYKSIDINENKK